MAKLLSGTREMDMCTGPLFRKILVFTLPIMASNVLQMLFNMADTIIVGRYSAEGSDALAAVGTTTAIIYLVINLTIGLSVGTNVLVARYYGAKDYKRLSDAVHTSVMVGLICGILTSVLGFALTPALLRFVGAPEDVFGMAQQYMHIYFAGFVSLALYNFGAAILRAVGDTQRPLLYMLISGALNVVLNLFFVIVLKLSVAGVAYATVISQTVSAVLVLITVIRTDSVCKVTLSELRLEKAALRQILAIGIPAGLQSSLFSLSNTVVQSSVNSFGKAVMAGNTAACNVENILYVSMSSLSNAGLAFTGQNMGAGKPENVKKVLGQCMLINLMLGAAMDGILIFFGEVLLRIFDASDPDMVAAGMERFRLVGNTMVICSAMEILAGMNRGFGRSVAPMIVSLVGSCLTRILWLKTVFVAYPTLENVFIVYPISWVLTVAAHFVCFVFIYRKEKQKLAIAASV